MKLITAFLRLIRTVNLLFIVLTQFLFQYCIVIPILQKAGLSTKLDVTLFWLLVLASVFIAAAGYIINDYFDLNIDRINKPEKLVIEKHIKRRWAIAWHMMLSATGVALSFYIGWKINHTILLGFSNLACVILLWVYSTTFKKQLLTGNIIISLLTGWVVLVLFVAELELLFITANDPALIKAISQIYKLAALYGGFAFIISLIREVIKDIEDMPGDQKYGCRTMPIVWGVNVSKIFAATWLVVLIAVILLLQLYVFPYEWWWSIIYAVLFILIPLVIIFRKLTRAQGIDDYRSLSKWVKVVMMTGILSMIFFKIYL